MHILKHVFKKNPNYERMKKILKINKSDKTSKRVNWKPFDLINIEKSKLQLLNSYIYNGRIEIQKISDFEYLMILHVLGNPERKKNKAVPSMCFIKN